MATILVLEDQAGWDALIGSALRHGHLPPCDVHRASSYAEAMTLLREVKFDIALLDYILEAGGPAGARTGLDVARELRAISPAARIFLVTLADVHAIAATSEQLGVRIIEKGRGDLEDEIVREMREGLFDGAGPHD